MIKIKIFKFGIILNIYSFLKIFNFVKNLVKRMARIVLHERNHPYVIKLDNGQELHICACGLSANKPYCDGHHKKTQDEETGKIYLYDENGNRVKIVSFYP